MNVGMLAALLLSTGPMGSAPPAESPVLLQEKDDGMALPPTGRGDGFQAAEPRRGAAAAAEAAAAGPSAAVLAAIGRLEARGAPPGEVFALVRITDRRTGRRTVLVRGEPDFEAARLLDEPENAPSGIAYEEISEGHAEGGVEIAIRSIRTRPASAPARGWKGRQEERARELRERNPGKGLSHRIERGLRRRIASGELALSDNRLIPVAIELTGVRRLRLPKVHDVAENGLVLAGLEVAAARERAIIERKVEMASRQEDLARAVEAAGGRITWASWTSGSLEAEVPAGAIETLARHRDVFSIDHAEPQVESTHFFQGDDYFVATDAQDYDQHHSGLHGLSAKHPYTSRVVLAMGEKCIDQTNPAWLNAAPPGGSTRGFFYDCDPVGPCSQGGVENCSGSSAHGTRVAQLMAGDFMDGQDPALTTLNARRLTGTCPECRLFFFQDQNLNNRQKTLNAACDVGVDIFQSSISNVSQSCDGNGWYDSTLQSLIDCDAVYIQSASNDGPGPGCTTHYPADHPWTLAVAGLGSPSIIVTCASSGAYYGTGCTFHSNSSSGGATYDGNSGAASVIDLVAPFDYHNAILPLFRNPVRWGSAQGTSFATPLVAGLTARMMDWYNVHLDSSIFYNNRMRNFMLLFGDRSEALDGSVRLINDTSVLWGAGRVGLVPFDNRVIWDIYRASTTLARGDSWAISVPVTIFATFFKTAVWHDGQNYANEPILQVELDPQGCAAKTLTVNRLDNKVVMAYTDLELCSSINVTITNVGSGFSGSRTYHFAAYADTLEERSF
jgi:hypothetical protein